MNNIYVAPSILSADFSKMSDEIKKIEIAGADLIHCDVMDGLFVPNITFGPKMIKDIRKTTKLPLDVHLMIVEPERYLDNFIEAGADYLTIHVEATKKAAWCLEHIKSKNVKCGMVISPDTKVEALKDYMNICNMVLLMSVYPGFGGQKFIEKSIDRLKELVELKSKTNSNALIEIDGGINLDNYKLCVENGVNVLVAGNTVFNSQNPKNTITQLKKI